MANPELPSRESVRGLHDLTGQVALVTGGGSGLGRAMAWGFACHGASIAIVDRDAAAARACAAEIAAASGCRTASAQADVSNESDVARASREIEANLGPVDILLNNAGHNVRKPLVEYTLEEFDSLHAVHVRGTFLFCRALAREMCKRNRGTIINIASMLGMVAAPNVAPYAAAKAALIQVTRVLALELAPFGVRVNALAPGYIDTPLTRTHPEAVRSRITGTTPLGRFGEAHELIGPALFLASRASSFVTGSVLVVDGGWTAQ